MMLIGTALHGNIRRVIGNVSAILEHAAEAVGRGLHRKAAVRTNDETERDGDVPGPDSMEMSPLADRSPSIVNLLDRGFDDFLHW